MSSIPEIETSATSKVREQIIALENESDRLAETAEQCGRILMAAKASVLAGAVVLGLIVSGIWGSRLAPLMSVAAILGGFACSNPPRLPAIRSKQP